MATRKTKKATSKKVSSTKSAASLSKSSKSQGTRKPAFITQKPPASPTVVGEGAFDITGKAANRLDTSNKTGYPGAPLPFTEAITGDSVVTPQRLWYYKLTRFNPIKQLKPETLAHFFDLFQQGYLRYFALMADAIEHRDPVLMSVIPKRKAAIKRLDWEIVKAQDLSVDEDKIADAQKEALYQFYSNIKASSAVDLNKKGGMPMLLDFAMNCVGMKYSTFEIIWDVMDDGNITARFNHIPLWFFENRTGKLRFLTMDYSLDGVEMKDGSFVTFVGEGLMEPCAVSYMFKHLCLRDWLMYCEKCAMPGIIAKTDSPYGSDYYNALVNAVHDVATDFSAVVGKDDEIETVDFSRAGELPYHPLVDYMDRVMSAIWRGADLSTMSARSGGQSGGQGASLQGKEETYIQQADAMMLNEVFNNQIDPLVLQWHFGKGVKPLVYFKLIVPPTVDAASDIAIINALLSWGVTEIGQKQMIEHFGLGEMMESDTACISPQESQLQLQQEYAPPEESGFNAANELDDENVFIRKLLANAIRIRNKRKFKLELATQPAVK